MTIEFQKARRKPRGMTAALLSFISFILCLSLSFSGVFSLFELKVYDLLSLYASKKNIAEDIVIVRVDQRSIDAFNKNQIPWPWPRQVYEPVLAYLKDAEALFLDVIFSEPSVYGEEDDRIFSTAVKQAGNVFTAMPLTDRKARTSPDEDIFLNTLRAPEDTPFYRDHEGYVSPINGLKQGIAGAGNVTIAPDDDGIYRKMPLFFGLNGRAIPHLVMSYFVKKQSITHSHGRIYLDQAEIPLVDNQLLLRFDGRKNVFKTYSFGDVFNRSLNSDGDKTSSKNPFDGKFVFMGYTAKGLYDLRPTPVSPTSPGVFVLATAFENLVHKNFLKTVDKKIVAAIMLVISLITTFFVIVNNRILVNLTFFIIFVLILSAAVLLLFHHGTYLNTMGPFSALFISYLLTLIFSYSSEGRQRAFIRATFSRYMDKKIVDHILANPQLVAPGGHRARGTVFFTDIAGFTTISETISAEETAGMLYEVLTVMSDLIIKNQGVIDKYIGDCIMAFWGAPAPSEDDEKNACKAALACLHALEKVNKNLAENIPPVNMRFGIHSGDLIVGNLGSAQLFDYTVIGDTVNLASRLESVNKFFHTRIIISEETRKKTDNLFITRLLGDIAVKGKTEPIRIYELIGRKEKLDGLTLEKITEFEKGVALFYEQQFANAREIFYNLLKKFKTDGPTEFYLKRCKSFIASPPLGDDWHIIVMREK